MLEAMLLYCDRGMLAIRNSPVFSSPTLRRLVLDNEWDEYPDFTYISDFKVNWAADLTSVTIRGGRRHHNTSFDEIAKRRTDVKARWKRA